MSCQMRTVTSKWAGRLQKGRNLKLYYPRIERETENLREDPNFSMTLWELQQMYTTPLFQTVFWSVKLLSQTKKARYMLYIIPFLLWLFGGDSYAFFTVVKCTHEQLSKRSPIGHCKQWKQIMLQMDQVASKRRPSFFTVQESASVQSCVTFMFKWMWTFVLIWWWSIDLQIVLYFEHNNIVSCHQPVRWIFWLGEKGESM